MCDEEYSALVCMDDAEEFLVADCCTGGEYDVDLANARLIAAAPDLLDLARCVAEHFAGTDAPLGADARYLIAKATNESVGAGGGS